MINFEEHYEKEIEPLLHSFEGERVRIVAQILKVQKISYAVYFLIFIIASLNFSSLYNYQYLFFEKGIWILLFFMFGMPAIIGIAVEAIFSGNYARDYKNRIISKILCLLDKDLLYSPDKFMPKSDYTASGLCGYADHEINYKGEDLVEGRFSGIDLSFSEIDVDRKTFDKNSSVFKGIFLKASFAKKFNCMLIVDGHGQFTKIKGLETIMLESPNFNETFRVFSDDQIMARAILTTTMIEKIVNFSDSLKSLDIRENATQTIAVGPNINSSISYSMSGLVSLSFSGNNLYMAISAPDLFEPKLHEPAFNFALHKEYFELLSFFLGVANELGLEDKSYKNNL